jgi:predicted transcriptional regulator
MEPENLPIGYWIKQADNLLSEGINHIHEATGINRTAWQLLHLIWEEKEIIVADLVEMMRPFCNATQVQETLEQLATKNLVVQTTDHSFSLTSEGLEFHDRCFKKQKEFRTITMQNISAEDYAVTVKTLRKMVGNLSGL